MMSLRSLHRLGHGLLLGLGILSPDAGRAQTRARVDSSSTIVTSGRGDVTMSPDRAMLRITLATSASTAAQAANTNAVRLRKLVDSLNAFRQPDESVFVAGVAVGPHYNQNGRVEGYQAAAAVRVALRTLERVGRILDAALAAGATSVDEITWLSDREETSRREALALAFAEARRNAEALARAAGLELGPLLRMTTEPEYGGFGVATGYVRAEAATVSGYGRVPIVPRDVVVRASVQVSWRLLSAAR